jgi:hypothetical protein
MKIAGFIPNPESAVTVVNWTLAFRSEEDEVEFLCYESWFGSKTQQAAKEALGKKIRMHVWFQLMNNWC